MSVIAGKELHDLIDAGVIDALHENVNAASIDVRLGKMIQMESDSGGDVDLVAKEMLNMREQEIPEFGKRIYPGEFFLGHTVEVFHLPANISAKLVLRSSVGRSALDHCLAGWADAGFNDAQLTLEFKNVSQYHNLIIRPGMRIGQMVFYRHADSGENSYAIKGRYNGQRGATGSKGL